LVGRMMELSAHRKAGVFDQFRNFVKTQCAKSMYEDRLNELQG